MKTYWIGKTKDNVLGHKFGAYKYLYDTLSESQLITERSASFLMGFGSYEVVEIEIRELNRRKRNESKNNMGRSA